MDCRMAVLNASSSGNTVFCDVSVSELHVPGSMSEYDYEGHTANNMSRPTETNDFFRMPPRQR